MAQFTKYTSGDVGAPQLTGRTGKLIAVLDFALVTGQGWTHPVATASDIATYKAPSVASGTARTLLVNDAGVDGTSTYKEAYIVGWNSCTGVGTPLGAGAGQFPLASQIGTTGHLWVRKSVAVDDVARTWVIYADTRSFYMFIKSEGNAVYYGWGFGEFYSLAGSADQGNCFITARGVTAATVNAREGLDGQASPFVQTSVFGARYLANTVGGVGGSQQAYSMGDPGKQSGVFTTSVGLPLLGNMPTPNTSDGAYYLSPLKILDASGSIRGRYRGLYHLCHPLAQFADGTTFDGSGAYAGKSFIVINSGDGGGMTCLETSNTLDTN